MTIDKFKPLTVYTIYIASTPEKVWEALTSSQFSQKYFYHVLLTSGLSRSVDVVEPARHVANGS